MTEWSTSEPPAESSSSENEADLSDEELARINDRLARVLGRFDALPYHGLLYRVGEVASKRVEERALRRALAELANNRRPRHGRLITAGLWEGRRKIYVASDASQRESVLAADAATPALRELTQYTGENVIDPLSSALASAVRATESAAHEPTVERVEVGGGIEYPVHDRVLQRKGRKAKSPVHILVLHGPGWLYPDDRRLWQFLIDCHRAEARAVIVARAIAPGTFPMLKAVGAVGAQYYSTLVPQRHLTEANRLRDVLGWSHIRAVEAIARHSLIEHLKRTIDRLSFEHISPLVMRALDGAREAGLASAPTVPGVLRWWHSTDLVLPAPVVRGWMRWTVWDSYEQTEPATGEGEYVGTSNSEEVPAITEATAQQPANETNPSAINQQTAGSPRGFGRETQVIPLGLPLSWREFQEILASARESARKRRTA